MMNTRYCAHSGSFVPGTHVRNVSVACGGKQLVLVNPGPLVSWTDRRGMM